MSEEARWESRVRRIDDQSLALYLRVPASQVVLLQSYFELYEGIGIVRTIDAGRSLVCILTTESQAPHCFTALESLRESIQWQFADPPPEGEG